MKQVRVKVRVVDKSGNVKLACLLSIVGVGSRSNDPFLLLLGLSGGGNFSTLGNITGNVLQSLDNAFQGIQVAPTDPVTFGEGPFEHHVTDNETIPIFQDIHVILDDSGNVNGSAIMVMVNNTPVSVDLTNPTIVYDPSK